MLKRLILPARLVMLRFTGAHPNDILSKKDDAISIIQVTINMTNCNNIQMIIK